MIIHNKSIIYNSYSLYLPFAASSSNIHNFPKDKVYHAFTNTLLITF